MNIIKEKICYICLEECENKSLHHCFLCNRCNAFICKRCLKYGNKFDSFKYCGQCRIEPIDRIDNLFICKINLFYILLIFIKGFNFMIFYLFLHNYLFNRIDITINYFINILLHQIIVTLSFVKIIHKKSIKNKKKMYLIKKTILFDVFNNIFFNLIIHIFILYKMNFLKILDIICYSLIDYLCININCYNLYLLYR